jgi:hypothetical protein
MSIDEQRDQLRERYLIGAEQGYFDAGFASGSRQVLMGFFWTGLVALFFDMDGYLMGEEVRAIPPDPPKHPRSGCFLSTPEYERSVASAMTAWQTEIGFRPHAISVRRFEADGLAIEDQPSHYVDFVADPERYAPDAGERERLARQVHDWDRRGCFVLHWGADLWLNGLGDVESS